MLRARFTHSYKWPDISILTVEPSMAAANSLSGIIARRGKREKLRDVVLKGANQYIAARHLPAYSGRRAVAKVSDFQT